MVNSESSNLSTDLIARFGRITRMDIGFISFIVLLKISIGIVFALLAGFCILLGALL